MPKPQRTKVTPVSADEASSEAAVIAAAKAAMSRKGPALVARVMGAVRKEHGEDALNGATLVPLDVLSTRCETLNAATGVGGIPFRRVTVISGAESSGKTTIALHLCAEVQRLGGIPVYFDRERKLDLGYAANLDVDIDGLILSPARTIERCFEVIKGIVDATKDEPEPVPIVCIIDSVNALRALMEEAPRKPKKQPAPKKAPDGGEDAKEEPKAEGKAMLIAAQARAMSEGLPKLIDVINESHSNAKVAVVFISQPRTKIGGYGGQEQVASGNALRFYSSLVIQLAKVSFFEESGSLVGSEIQATVKKSSISVPMRKAEYRIIWGKGIDRDNSLIRLAITLGVMNEGAAGWNEFGKWKWQGRLSWNKLVAKSPEVVDELRAACRARVALKAARPKT